jgi:hypothetical protein
MGNCILHCHSCEKFESVMVSVLWVLGRHRHSRNNKKVVIFNTSNYDHLSSTLLLDPVTKRAVAMTLVVTSREVTAVSELHQTASYNTDRAFKCGHGDCPFDVPSSSTTWIYINSNHDAPDLSYHQSVDGRPVSPAVRGGDTGSFPCWV